MNQKKIYITQKLNRKTIQQAKAHKRKVEVVINAFSLLVTNKIKVKKKVICGDLTKLDTKDKQEGHELMHRDKGHE